MNTGTSSAVSVFRGVVWVAWVGTILTAVYLAIGVPSGATDARMVNPWISVGPWDTGLVIGVSREAMTADEWRSFCLRVGVWNLASTVAVLVAVDQVRRILSGDMTKSPFTSANGRRVRIAGLAVICAAGAKAGRDIVFGRFVAESVRISGAQVGYLSDLGLSTAFLGIMILAMAEVMRHGVKLQEDQDLTV